jgi:putative DNA primase/helicase
MNLEQINPGAGSTGASGSIEAEKLQDQDYPAKAVDASGVKPAFVTGYGQSDTHARSLHDGSANPHESAATAYATITGAGIAKMVKEPPTVPKERGQWFIASTYAAQDARSHDVQKARGVFRWLTLDVDENNLGLDEIDAALSKVIGDACRFIYSSRSATQENRKWRALVPLATEISGADFSDTQNAFFDLLEQASDGTLIPDRALSRPAQLVYLPNRGEFYEVKADQANALTLTPDSAIMAHKAAIAADRASTAQEAQAARERRAAQRIAKVQGDDVSPVDHFNAAHSVADLLAHYGYSQAGSSNDWKSPFQSSGSYATRDCGDHWISLSGSDDAQEIGAATQNGHRFGDAFDLFRHFDHRGDVGAAVRAYALESGIGRKAATPPARGQHNAAQGQEAHDPAPDAPEPRSYDELLEAAQTLEPGQIDDMEAIVSESAGLTPMRRDAIFRAIKDATGVPLGTIRDQLLQERDAIPEPDHLDLARMTLDGIGRDNVICTDAFVWRWQDRGVWKQQDDRAIKQAVQSRLDGEHMIDVMANLVNGVTDVLKSDIYRPEHEFNRGNPETVNCLNGELALDEFVGWHLEPHCRENYRTTQIPVAYDPLADAPLFRAFLEQVFRDDPDMLDKIKCALELMGYTLMSHAQHELFVMLIGAGANGKSVLLAILEGLAGVKNVAGVQPANFDRSFQRAHLHQKLANIVTELKQGEVIADAELKAITSGEASTVEHKFKDPFVMRPFATCWFGTNHMPHTRDFSEALFRRATILKFNRTFAKQEQDPQLKGKLLAELPGILNMSLDAYALALTEGFTSPASSEAAKQDWRLEADQVAQFVDDVCTRDLGAKATSADVFHAYRNWAGGNGIHKAMSKRGLRDRLTRLGFGADKDRAARYVTGLRLPS